MNETIPLARTDRRDCRRPTFAWQSRSLAAGVAALLFCTQVNAADITGLEGTVTALAFSPSGHALAAADSGSNLTLWDVASGKSKGKYPGLMSGSTHLAWSPDSKLVYGTSGNDWVACDGENAAEKKKVRGEMTRTTPKYVTLSKDGKIVAGAGNGQVKLWVAASGQALGEYEVHPNYGINAVAFSPDGKWFSTAAMDRTARLVETATGKLGFALTCPGRVQAVEFAPDSKTLFAADANGFLHQLDVATGVDHAAAQLPREAKQIAVSPDGRLVACSGPSLQIWVRAENRWHKETVTDSAIGASAVAWSPDGKQLAYGDGNGRIRFWSPAKLSTPP